MKYKRTKLSLLISSILLGATVSAAEADENLTEREKKQIEADESVITVVGTRGAIQRATEIKRTADSLIDVISMEDIGQMQDESIAEALDRVSGITITEATDTGQVSETLIRGLGSELTLTTYNGRELASNTQSRALKLGYIPGELLNEARVVKSPTADMIEGGVAGSIDLRSARALSYDKRIMAVNVKADHSDMPENPLMGNTGVSTTFSYIDQLLDDKLGITVGATFKKTPKSSTQNKAKYQPYSWPKADANDGYGDITGDGIVDMYQRQVDVAAKLREQETKGLSLALQWKPTDATEINFDSMISNSFAVTDESMQLYRINNKYWGGSKLGKNNSMTVNVCDDDIIGSITTRDGMTEVNGCFVTDGDVHGAEFWNRNTVTENTDDTDAFGLNIAHTFANGWQLEGDIAYSSADGFQEAMFTSGNRKNIGWNINYNGEGGQPVMSGHNDSTTGEPIDITQNPVFSGSIYENFYPDSMTYWNKYISDELTSARIDLNKDLE